MIFSLALISTVGKGYVVAGVLPLCLIYRKVFIRTKGQNTTISSLYPIMSYCSAMFKEAAMNSAMKLAFI